VIIRPEATEKAKRLVDGHAVEVWSGPRLLGFLYGHIREFKRLPRVQRLSFQEIALPLIFNRECDKNNFRVAHACSPFSGVLSDIRGFCLRRS
jgi:hypothetical protein